MEAEEAAKGGMASDGGSGGSGDDDDDGDGQDVGGRRVAQRGRGMWGGIGRGGGVDWEGGGAESHDPALGGCGMGATDMTLFDAVSLP